MSRHFPSFSISDKDAKGLVDDAFTSATIELDLLFCMKRGIFMEDERIINAVVANCSFIHSRPCNFNACLDRVIFRGT